MISTAARGLLAVSLLGLAACGSDPGSASGSASESSPVELTPEGIADVVADHVDRAPDQVEAWDVMTRELGVESPGASVGWKGGDQLSVAVTPSTDNAFTCADESFFDECATFEHEGTELVLGWQELEPEEDPGVVYVVDVRDDEAVIADYSGVAVEGDPREVDLGVSVEQMAAIVTDARLTLGPTE